MAWKATGRPAVRRQRGRWVVRVDGIDTVTGKTRPRQIGTFPSQRAATNAAKAAIVRGDEPGSRALVSALVDKWIASRTDLGVKQLEQYRWAAKNISEGIGGIRLDQLDRSDIAGWLTGLAESGALSRRSIQIMRMTLRAALAWAVTTGDLTRSPALGVPLPRHVARPGRSQSVRAWDEAELGRFVAVAADHRWGGPMILEAFYGLRRSELLALRWSNVDLRNGRITIDAGLVDVAGHLAWTEGKNARSRRTFHVDAEMRSLLRQHRDLQRRERETAGAAWVDHDLVVVAANGRPVQPRNYARTLDFLVAEADVPRLTSHGLRHTAATHMVSNAADLGEVRAAAKILGHSPEMLMKTYSHALPVAVQTVTTRIGERSRRTLAAARVGEST